MTWLSPTQTGIDFRNDIEVSDSINILNYIYAFNGGGVGVGDLNNDGLEDLVFSGNRVPSRVYLNMGDMKFKDITALSGVHTETWCTGISLADINGDGHLDIYFSVAGDPNPDRRKNLLYLNKGNARFEEVAQEWGLADTSYTTQAAFLDYDRDGDLDLYLLNHDNDRAILNTPLPRKLAGESPTTDRLYRNDGFGRFVDVSTLAGISVEGYGLGVTISDINSDGWPDIYVSNDFISNDIMYVNQKDGTFKNVISKAIREQSYNSMGNDVADFNNDGLMDIAVVDMLSTDPVREKMMAGSMNYDKFMLIRSMGYEDQFVRNTLQLNRGGMHFSEIGRFAGIHRTDWSWAPLLVDLDNDGLKDLYVSNGYLRDITNKDFIDYNNNLSMFKSTDQADKEALLRIDQLEPLDAINAVFRNTGQHSFEPMINSWSGARVSLSNGAAYADLDNDGDLDMILNNLNEEATIIRNDLQLSNYLQINLVGPKHNSVAIGAKVKVTSASTEQWIEHSPVRGYMSSVSAILHFGLGEDTLVHQLEVHWPDSKITRLSNILSNQRVILRYPDAQPTQESDNTPLTSGHFVDVASQVGITLELDQPAFDQFKRFPLFPYRRPDEKLALAVGDYDNNNFDDFAIGEVNDSLFIYYQQPDGHFIKEGWSSSRSLIDLQTITDDNGEPMGLLALHSSGLYLYPYAMYGILATEPVELMRGRDLTAVSVTDYNEDGLQDILYASSHWFPDFNMTSEIGLFTLSTDMRVNFSNEVLPFKRIDGLITDIKWADFTADGRPDIVIVGEWMEPVFLENTEGKFDRIDPFDGKSHMSGWWSKVLASDVDADGDTDLILGNRGLNHGYRVDASDPVYLHLVDINGDGAKETMMTYTVNGQETFQVDRETLLRRFPFLTRLFPNHHSYASANTEEVIQQLNPHKTLLVNESASYFLKNEGGRLVASLLPHEAQLFPVGDGLVHDLDRNGHNEILLAGGIGVAEKDGRSYGNAMPTLLTFDEEHFSHSEVKPPTISSDIQSIALLKDPNDHWLLVVAAQGEELALLRYCEGKK